MIIYVLRPRKVGCEILIKQNSKAKVREKWNCIFVKENISQDSETTTDNKKASLKKLKARK